MRINLEFVVRKPLYSPGWYCVLETEVDVVHYAVCETAASVFPVIFKLYLPHSKVNSVPQQTHQLHPTIFLQCGGQLTPCGQVGWQADPAHRHSGFALPG